jgi:hypothetical protein
MIEKARTIWITGFLQRSLFQETRIVLGLSERPDAVARPLDLLVRRPDEGERPLPSGIQVVDVFDSMNHSLLILGMPGSGKTTLLLADGTPIDAMIVGSQFVSESLENVNSQEELILAGVAASGVPEPSSLVTLAIGLGGMMLAAVGRRMKKGIVHRGFADRT